MDSGRERRVRASVAWVARVTAAVAALACAGAATAAAPSESPDFAYCDGRTAPTDKTDGLMSQEYGALIRVVRNGPTPVSRFPPSASGVAACDRALADPRLTSDMWMRRVSLLRGRAVHHLGAGDPAAALHDLDAAEAAAKGHEPQFLYERSLGIGIRLLRAYAYRQMGRRSEAEALALKVWKSRPFGRGVIRAALVVVGPDGDRKVRDTLWRALARVEPEALSMLYFEAYDEGRFDEAMGMRDQLVPTMGKNAGDMGLAKEELQDAQNHLVWELFWLDRSGERAYALAAQGQFDAARAELAQAQAHLAAQQPIADGRKLFSNKPAPPGEESVKLNDQLKSRGAVSLARWTAVVEMRIDVAQGRAEAAVKRFDPRNAPSSGATVELLRAMAAAGQKPPMDPDAIAQNLARARSRWTSSLEGVQAYLPEPEGWAIQPQYRPLTQDGWNWQRWPVTGFSADAGTPADSGGTIRYQASSASKMVVQEMALLRAADMARRMHKGLVIRAAVDRREVLVRDGMFETPQGWQTELEVVFVDPANPPEKYRGAAWRILDPEEVYAALSPGYPSRN